MLGPIHYHQTESSQSTGLGTVYRQDSSNRSWRYAENGAVAADPGKLFVAAAHDAQFSNMNFQTAPAAGDSSVKVTLGSTAASADDFAEGFLNFQDGTGEGLAYLVDGHDAASASATLEVNLQGEVVKVAGALSEANADLVKSLYKDVVISSTDQADPPAGVFNVSVAANAYGMLQTWGPCAVWQDEAVAIGDMIVTGTGVAGQVEADDAAGEPILGIQGPVTGVDTEYQLVYLRIDP